MKDNLTILEPCRHEWHKVGVCKTCKVKKLKWQCTKCHKVYLGITPPSKLSLKQKEPC